MKKMFKSRIFIFVLGMIISTSIYVVADNLLASEVDYRDTKVDQALDTLYTTATTYKNLTPLQNELTASDLLSGKKAYNSNGEVIEGTSTKAYTEEEYQAFGDTRFLEGRNTISTGTFTATAGDNIMNIGFVPKKLVVTNDANRYTMVYNSYSSTNRFFMFTTNGYYKYITFSGSALYSGNLSDGSDHCTSNCGAVDGYIKSVGSTANFYINSNAATLIGQSFTWFATQ